jgi:hypothetical protein
VLSRFRTTVLALALLGGLALIPVPAVDRATDQATGVRPVAAASGRAPLGDTAVGTWWYPGPTRFDASNLWVFDPVNEATPYGWRKGYQPTGTTLPAVEQQFSFVYTRSGNTISLSYPSGTRQQVTVLGYDAQNDVLSVAWSGYRQLWVGCRSGRMPAVAAAACR